MISTGALEAQNGVLGKRLMKHGNFFKFVAYLLSHEYTKAREFQLLIDSGGTTAPPKKKANKDRAEKIREATLALERGEISPPNFLLIAKTIFVLGWTISIQSIVQ